MATPPTRVSYHVQSTTPFLSTGTPKTCTGVTFQVGDFLEIKASAEQHGTSATVTPTLSAGAATWTKYADVGAAGTNNSGAWSWVGVVTAAATNATVTLARPTGTNIQWGFTVSVIRGSSGVGVRFEGTNGTSSTAPSVVQTVQANSLLTCQINDWNAVDGATRTWRTVNGSPITEASYYRSASTHTIYGGYVADAGAGGSVTMGLTTPSTQRWVMSGFEFLGTTAGSSTTGSLSAGVARVTSSISGMVTTPAYTGMVSSVVPRVSSSLAGTTAGPAYSGTLSASTPRPTATLAGTVTTPTYSGTLTATTTAVTGSVAGTTTAPGSSGTIAATTPRATASIAGTHTPPTYSGTIAATTPTVTGGMSGGGTGGMTGVVTEPTYTGTLTAALPPTRATITGTATNPAGAATLSAAIPRPTASLAGTVTAPVWTATLSARVARATGTMLGTSTPPTFAGTIAGATPRTRGTITGTVTTPTVSGTLSGALPRLAGGLAGSSDGGPPSEFTGRILTAALAIPAARGSIAVPAAAGGFVSHRASGRLSTLRARGVIE